MKKITLFSIIIILSNHLMAQDWVLLQQKFREAIAQNDKAKVEQYIYAGTDINNNKNQYGGEIETPLMVALRSNHLEMVQLLIEKGARVNLPQGQTYPIQIAVLHSSYQIIEYLLSKGGNASICSKQVQDRGDINITKLLNSKGMNIQYTVLDLNTSLFDGRSMEYINAILAQGVRPDGLSLAAAVRRKDYNLIHTLIKYGLNVNEKYQNRRGGHWSGICEAINSNDLRMIKFLVEELGMNPVGVCSWTESAGLGVDTKSYVEWSKEHMYCKCRFNKTLAEEVTEYLLLAPGIARQKDNEKREQIFQQAQQRKMQENEVKASAKIIKSKGDSLMALGNYTDAISSYQQAYEVFNDFQFQLALGNAYYVNKNYKEALSIFNQCLSNDACTDRVAWCEMRLGNTEKAKKYLEYLGKKASNYEEKRNAYYNLACFYSLVKDQKQTLEYLKQALKNGYSNFEHLKQDSDLDTFRNTEEFLKLIEKYKK